MTAKRAASSHHGMVSRAEATTGRLALLSATKTVADAAATSPSRSVRARSFS